jgi:eukaryotic-like serine/threonine-protein kinase
VVVALLILLVLAGLAFGAYRLLADGQSNSVTVPSVLGSKRQAAEEELRTAGLQPAFRNVSGPKDDSVGTVIKQTPEPGTDVVSGGIVTAEINVGPATKRIPKVLVGKDLDAAVQKLTDAGFTNVLAVPVANPPAGTRTDEVVKVDPPEGARAAPEQDITLSYVGRAARAPTRGTNQQPAGGKSSRPSERESSDAEESEEPGESSEPSGEASSEGPSSAPSDSTEPEPSATEPSESEPSASASSGGAPSAEAPSDPPGGEEPSVSVEPADASGTPAKLTKKSGG